jgi:hypothetical protein
MAEAATRVSENGYSGVGRALQKKLGRPNERAAWRDWSPTKGDPAGYNDQGRRLLEEILNDPRVVLKLESGRVGTPARWEDLVVYRLPDGRGAAFTKDGFFVGFRSKRAPLPEEPRGN